jgi:hypothetical protein
VLHELQKRLSLITPMRDNDRAARKPLKRRRLVANLDRFTEQSSSPRSATPRFRR